MLEMTEKPGVEETYQVAGNTSNLTVEAEKRGAGDVLIAAGWSQSRLGMALLRLHSEWDATSRLPKQAPLPTVAAIAAKMPAVVVRVERTPNGVQRKVQGPNLKAAAVYLERLRLEAERARVSELRLLGNALKGRPAVWDQLAPWLALKGISSDIGAEALLYWLHPTCPACDGHGLRKVPNAPALSARRCSRCHGAGKKPHPEGTAKVLVYLDECVSRAQQSLKKRLRSG